MHQNAAFPEAENILWDLATSDDINYTLNTSENWLKKTLLPQNLKALWKSNGRSVIESTLILCIQINNDRKFTK
jgi:hypothetical protein